jgi:hypothetical protein
MQLWDEAVEACERALEIDERFDSEAKIKLGVYELLVEAERGRGHAAAADRAQQRVEALSLELKAN